MTEIMFEAFGTPSFYVALQAVLGLYTSGHLTSVVVDSGHGSSYSVPVYEGHSIPRAVTQSTVTGRELILYLKKILQKRDFAFVTNAEFELVREIKETICYITSDFEKELSSASPSRDTTYELPTGEIVNIGKACFECPEALFQPGLIGFSDVGIHEMCCNSIKRCDRDIHTALARNIVLSGGTTLFPGMIERFNKEMIDVAPPTIMIKVSTLPERKNSAWIGGSMLASLPTFQKMLISKGEYNEFGPSIVHRKCF